MSLHVDSQDTFGGKHSLTMSAKPVFDEEGSQLPESAQCQEMYKYMYIDGLEQNCSFSIVNALGILQSCIKP